MSKPNPAIAERVRAHIQAVASVDEFEAFEICMYYTRHFGRLLAIASVSDEEFTRKMTELHRLMLLEGLSARTKAKVP